jgi:hypothetical protein
MQVSTLKGTGNLASATPVKTPNNPTKTKKIFIKIPFPSRAQSPFYHHGVSIGKKPKPLRINP